MTAARTPRRRWAERVVVAAALLATAAPPVVIARAVALHARNVPWRDQWGLIPFMAEATAGRFPFRALWVEVNEHRIPVALLLEGGVGWWTRWDVRGEAWLHVGLALGSLLALVALAHRTLPPRATLAVSPVFSLLVFSPIAAGTWTAAWSAPALAATFFATLTARVAAGAPTWTRLAATIATAAAGALSFGSGMVLVVLLPAVVLATPGAPPVRRAVRGMVALAAAVTIVWVYFIGWYPRWGVPPPVFRPDRAADYVRYALGFVGGAVGFRHFGAAQASGGLVLAAATLATVGLWWRRPERRGALVPWVLLVLYGLGNGFVTAYGRLGDGIFTAMLPRYVPTAGLFVAGTVGVVTLALAEVRARSTVAATAMLVALVVPLAGAPRRFADAARGGMAQIADVSRSIDRHAPCLTSCAAATDRCLGSLCWDAKIARALCPVMERARIGPFAHAVADRVASAGRPG